MRFIFSFLVFVLAHSIALAQSYTIQRFRAEDGLVTDLVKCVAQDSIGFIWIGTDEGLLKYDGVKFTHYPNAATSRYIKDFLVTSDNRLLAVHDMGIIQIESAMDGVKFKLLYEGDQVKFKDKLWYPKKAFEDSKNSIWVAEPQSIVKISNGSFQRFDFGPEDNSASFVRSFHFDDISADSILIGSYTGNFFIYDYTQDSIFKLPRPSLNQLTYQLKRVDDKLYLGGNDGLYELTLNSGKLELTPISINAIITDIVSTSDNSYLVCAEDNQSVFLEYAENGNTSISETNLNVSINQAFKSSENVIWLATLRGLYVFRSSDFNPVALSGSRTFVEGVFSDPNSNSIFTLNKEHIWELNKETGSITNSINQVNGYFLTGSLIEDEFWVSNEFSLWKYQNGDIRLKKDFSDIGRYIFDIYTCSGDTVWFSQEAAPGVTMYFPNEDRYSQLIPEPSCLVTAIEGSRITHETYFGTNNPGHYLYRYDHKKNELVDVSHAVEMAESGNFLINDLELIDDSLIVATGQGLWVHKKDTLYPLLVNMSLDKLPILSLTSHKKDLWIGSSIGLTKYDMTSGEHAQFNERVGMPINSVTEEGIYVDDDRIWIGTTSGLTYSDKLVSHFDQTPSPLILNLQVNGIEENSDQFQNVPFESLVELEIAAMSFPANEIEYSYRLRDETEWSAPVFNNLVRLSDLSMGTHLLEIKSKKLGKYRWSEPTQLSFTVNPPYYKTPFFFFMVVGVAILIISFTRFITRRIMIRRQLILRQLVDERTMELKNYKDNLEHLVKERTKELQETQTQLIQAEKMASLGTLTAGVAHEINNPINYLQGGIYSLDTLLKETEILKSDPEIESSVDEVTHNMQLGIDRITRIVASLGRYSRKSETQRNECNLHEIIDDCLMILSHETKGKCDIIKNYDSNLPRLLGDESGLHQLFSNLILNAAQAIDEQGVIDISTSYEDEAIIVKIKDNGHGIENEQVGKLFDPFFTTKPQGKGTGLGLYISHKVAEAHHAKLEFDSIPGEGTQVVCTFSYLELE